MNLQEKVNYAKQRAKNHPFAFQFELVMMTEFIAANEAKLKNEYKAFIHDTKDTTVTFTEFALELWTEQVKLN